MIVLRAGIVAGVLAVTFARAAAQSTLPAAAQARPTPSAQAGPGGAPALASPSPVASASPAALREIGRVFTSDRRSEALSNVTRPTFIVERSLIDAFGSRAVSDALANVPGVGLFPYGAFGAQAGYGIRGTTSAQTLVLRDGIPIATASSGTIDLGSLSTAGIQRIEVVQSASSTLYGSSATGGVINLISAAQSAPYARVATGTLGDHDYAAEAGLGGLSLSLERHTADNVYAYPAFNYRGGLAQAAGVRSNDYALQSALRASYAAKVASFTARLSGGLDAIALGVPGSIAVSPYGSQLTPSATQGTARSDGQFDLSHALGAGQLTLTLGGSTQRLAYNDPLLVGGEDDTYDGRTQASLRYTAAAARSDLTAGLDVVRSSAALSFGGPGASPDFGAAQSQTAAYAQFGYGTLRGTRLTLGLRAENDAPQGGVVAPSLGLRAVMGAARVTANVAESFRVPTLIDLYYPGLSNPHLVPEKLSNYDATLAFPEVLGGISAGFFGRDGANLIVLDPATFVPYNAARVSVNGLQLTAATLPYHHVKIIASLTGVYKALDTSSGARLPNAPPVLVTVGLERPFDGGHFALGARARVAGSNAGDGPQPNPFDAFTLADAYLRYRFSPLAVATLRVANLGNERYQPIYGYPAPGRTFVFELATR